MIWRIIIAVAVAVIIYLLVSIVAMHPWPLLAALIAGLITFVSYRPGPPIDRNYV